MVCVLFSFLVLFSVSKLLFLLDFFSVTHFFNPPNVVSLMSQSPVQFGKVNSPDAAILVIMIITVSVSMAIMQDLILSCGSWKVPNAHQTDILKLYDIKTTGSTVSKRWCWALCNHPLRLFTSY